MSKKICFVAMGFGKKMDYPNSKEIDLDITYKEIIKPLFEKELTDYQLIRADEIASSAVIDVGMYKLLLNADLVIADITTLNPNAIYELGVRHAVRPFSTIMMAQESCKLPFDLNHSNFLIYNDINEQMDKTKTEHTKSKLKEFVLKSENKTTDSPLYTFLPHITPPGANDKSIEELIANMENNKDTVSCLLKQATDYIASSNFEKATQIWEQLKKLLPNDDYVIQQLALATYKSKIPNETKALERALDIIKELNPSMSLDFETIGITGAIYKRLFRLNNNFDYLNDAIEYYKKGYIIKKDYYNGENYANCLLLYTKKEGLDADTLNYLFYESKKTYNEIIHIAFNCLKIEVNNYWVYATLAVCYFVLSDIENQQKYEGLFYSICLEEWQKETYRETIKELSNIVMTTRGGNIDGT